MANIHWVELNGELVSETEYCRRMGYNVNSIRAFKNQLNLTFEQAVEKWLAYKNRRKVKDRRLKIKWESMKSRCYNPNHPHYHSYGGRGIRVCERWQDYFNFEDDMLKSFLEHVEKYGVFDTTLEHENVDGDYCPENCYRWLTRAEQQNNKADNRMVTAELNASQFAKKYNLPYYIVLNRLNAGWSVEKIINTPVKEYTSKKAKYYLPCNGGTMSLNKHCEKNHYDRKLVIKYIKQYNLSPDRALAKYLREKDTIKTYDYLTPIKYCLPCNKSLSKHCQLNGYKYSTIVEYIKKYNLTPDKALAKYLEKRKK